MELGLGAGFFAEFDTVVDLFEKASVEFWVVLTPREETLRVSVFMRRLVVVLRR